MSEEQAKYGRKESMKEKLKSVQRLISLLSSMIVSGEEHSNMSRVKTKQAQEFLDEAIEKECCKPLFTTDDGVVITNPRTVVVLVDSDFTIDYKPAVDCNINTTVATTKLFFHESNADEYIWRNKRLFSYEEMRKANIDINWCTADIYYKAKERSKQ